MSMDAQAPSFIGIGAQKCASTWIYEILRDHPQACLSEPKELDFFSYRFDRGYQWYERQFAGAHDVSAVGEISPSYFHESEVAQRVRRYRPEMRIVLALRDPVQRAFSHHRHAVRVGDVGGDDLSFESALPGNPMYLEQGCYASHLARWLDIFPSEQLLVLFFEDIVRDPAAVAVCLYRFLGIDSEHRPASLEQPANASHVTPYPRLERARQALRGGAHALGCGTLWEWTAALGARRIYRDLNRRPCAESIPPVSEETHTALRNFFHDEVRRLESLTGRDLATWR